MTDTETSDILNNRYILREKLAEGGMGIVYRATDRLTGSDIALKQVKLNTMIPEDISTVADTMVERNAMAQEFRAVASIRHPNIISVLDFGFLDDGSPYFTMDYLEEFQDFFHGGISKPIPNKIDLLIELLDTLEYLHRRGLLHRDIKPGNVALYNDTVKVLDFGLSIDKENIKLTDTSDLQIVGTLSYMAPEILQGEKPTPSSDLYAVGVMAYEIFTGSPPYKVTNVSNLIFEIISGEPDFTELDSLQLDATALVQDGEATQIIETPTEPADDTVPVEAQTFDDYSYDYTSATEQGSIAWVVRKLLTKSPETRYTKAIDVVHDLNAILDRTTIDESDIVRESYLQSARFVGRDEEISVLHDVLEETMTGKGQAWLIGGETGVGKTRLIDELRIQALIEGFTTVRGHAVSSNDIPYQLWREPVRRMIIHNDVSDVDARILKELVHDIERLLDEPVADPETLEGDAYRERLQTSILSLFNDVDFPLLLILEDVHWATSSIEMLNRLATIIEDIPVMVIATYRQDDAVDLPEQLPDFRLLELKRLNRDDIARLSESIIGTVSDFDKVINLLYRETAGNVHFIIEILRELAEQSGGLHSIDTSHLQSEIASVGVLDILKRRLQQLPSESLTLLKMMALAGREIDLKIVEALDIELDKDAWFVSCSNSSVLDTTEEGQWRFVHDAMRRTVLNTIESSETQSLHATLAKAIEKVYGSQEEWASVLARHYQLAEDYSKELTYARIAADYALHIGDLQEARQFFERTLELINSHLEDTYEFPDLVHVQIQLGKTLQYLGEYEPALKVLEPIVKTLRTVPYPKLLADTLIEQAEVLKRQGNLATADDLVQEALELLTNLDDKRSMAYAMDRLGDIRYEQGDYTSALKYSEDGLAIATEIDDQIVMGSLLNDIGMIAFVQGNYEEARINFGKAKDIYSASGQRRAVATLEMNMGSVAGQSGDLDTCLTNFQNALDVFEAIGEKRLIGKTYNNLGFVASLKNDLTLSFYYYEESLKISRSIGNMVEITLGLLNLGDANIQLGEPREAKKNFTEALQLSFDSSAIPLVLQSLSHFVKIEELGELAPITIGHVLNNPASTQQTTERTEAVLAELREKALPLDIDALLEQGKTLTLDEIVTRILELPEK